MVVPLPSIADSWRKPRLPFGYDAQLERLIDALISKMTLPEKVGQLIQVEHTHVRPHDIRKHHFGAVLNGGNTVPGGGKYATAKQAVDEADQLFVASVDQRDGRTAVPIFWGTDAVHGHNNMFGATIFPHNVGLGAANQPGRVFELAAATAIEVRATGLDMSFAPAVSLGMDPRWGRFYESFSDNPDLTATLGKMAILGLQGVPGSSEFLGPDKVLACAKHFVGDGATLQGIDQGDVVIPERTLASRHGLPYFAALEAGVLVVMASFSSWNGDKLHGHQYLLTGVLKDHWGFDGFVIGDWNGHTQLPDGSSSNGLSAVLAGVDMLMVPGDWRPLLRRLLLQAEQGELPRQRLNDAVRRILRVKFRAGLFNQPSPARRPHAGDSQIMASQRHRLLARKAAAESMVLLKNDGSLLPLAPTARVAVMGDLADDIGAQCGGWTLSWQGTGNENGDFPHGTSFLGGIGRCVRKHGGVEWRARAVDDAVGADVAFVIFGEEPYAEFQGDRMDIGYEIDAHPNLSLLRELATQGIPTVAVLVSGRPLWINRHLNAATAFIVAWLPGTEGGALADLCFDSDGRAEFVGRLPHAWPNLAIPDGTELFPTGHGWSFKSCPVALERVAEEPGISRSGSPERPVFLYQNGRALVPFYFQLDHGWTPLPVGAGYTHFVEKDGLQVGYTSHRRQDDSITFCGTGAVALRCTIPRNDAGSICICARMCLRLTSGKPPLLRLAGHAVAPMEDAEPIPDRWTTLTWQFPHLPIAALVDPVDLVLIIDRGNVALSHAELTLEAL